ncbi:transposase [Geothermobacter hydrogeniphilus]|uniref:Transposase n=1 Tax=Geothermobacter hydrogeniphilus TaxID=1969733 RepID=A0A2K2H6D1_9BACT|nr:transposase [Geothermobacter hydrogeniphilus]PNU18800.1 transposase [Geothermobacter hydrogeniphilus]
MPRLNRGLADNHYYHLLNRGNGRQQVFQDDEDYHNFLDLLHDAKARYPIQVYSYCLLPNHFHLLVKPINGEDLSRWMQWLMTSHVRRHHRTYGTSGHVWQGRYKSFLVQEGDYLLTLLRYIEGNPVRAGLVDSCTQWRWSSCRERLNGQKGLVAPPPVDLPENWPRFVDRPLTDREREHFQRCVDRQAPFGKKDWQMDVCRRYGLESTLRKRGRPRKEMGIK